jgi:hypothetical protein
MNVAKGWNGNVVISPEGVRIARGLKGLLTRKRKGPDLTISFADIQGVRLLPATRLPGYVQVVIAQEAVSSDYLSTIRGDRTVTFTKRRTEEFTKVAAEIAEVSGVKVETVTDNPEYWATVKGAAPRGVRFSRDPAPKPIEWGSGSEDKRGNGAEA